VALFPSPGEPFQVLVPVPNRRHHGNARSQDPGGHHASLCGRYRVG